MDAVSFYYFGIVTALAAVVWLEFVAIAAGTALSVHQETASREARFGSAAVAVVATAIALALAGVLLFWITKEPTMGAWVLIGWLAAAAAMNTLIRRDPSLRALFTRSYHRLPDYEQSGALQRELDGAEARQAVVDGKTVIVLDEDGETLLAAAGLRLLSADGGYLQAIVPACVETTAAKA